MRKRQRRWMRKTWMDINPMMKGKIMIYNPSLAVALGPSQPSPHLNLAAVGLTPGGIGGAEGPDRIFVGGLPYYFTDTQIRELLESFGIQL